MSDCTPIEDLQACEKPQRRGVVTPRITEAAGWEITTKELRLMPYLQYCLVNSQNPQAEKMHEEEMAILQRWRSEGRILSGISRTKGRPMYSEKLTVSQEFWDLMSRLIWLGYVDLTVK